MWVSRDKGENSDVNIWAREPILRRISLGENESPVYTETDTIIGEFFAIPYAEFLRRYNLKLAPGDCKPVKLVEA